MFTSYDKQIVIKEIIYYIRLKKNPLSQKQYTQNKIRSPKNRRPLTIPNWNNWMSVIPDRRKIVDTGRAIFLEVKQAWR